MDTGRPPSPARPEPVLAPSIERRIGGQVFAVAGALIVVIGLALAVKVAVDQGWFQRLPPGLRCSGIAGFGVALLGAGEFLRTRVRGIAVAGCNAAGIGALYVAAYAAYGFFHLLPPAGAFALMAASAAVGMGIALRHGFLSTAALSLVGAYLVPVLLAQPDASPFVLPVYLALLSAVALSLAALRPRPFGPIRDLAWFGTGLLGLVWTIAVSDERPWLVITFWVLIWSMHQGELLISAARNELGQDRPAAARRRLKWLGRRSEPVLLAIATTAVVVAVTTLILQHQTLAPHWLAPGAGFAATALLGLVFGGHLRVLRDKPRSGLEVLAAAHAAQAGALLAVTLALALGGWVEVTAWLAMGLGAVLAGRWICARSLDLYGGVLLLIASIRLGTYDLLVGPASVPWGIYGGLALAPWTVLVLGAGAAWMAVAVLLLFQIRDEDGQIANPARPAAALGAGLLACLAWGAAPMHPESSALAVTVVWILLAGVLRAGSRPEPRLHLDAIAGVIAACTIVPWLLASDPAAWLAMQSAPGSPVGVWLGALVCASLAAHAWAARWWNAASLGLRARTLLAWLAGGVVFATTSIEIARSAGLLAHDETARRAALSIWWGLWGVGSVVIGFWRHAGPLRYVGLGLLSVAAIKAVVLDLAGVPPLWRVGSFVGLGGLMLGVAVLYGRISAAMDAPRADDSPGAAGRL